jgi:hypothetical protein
VIKEAKTDHPLMKKERRNQMIYRNSNSAGKGRTFRMHQFIPPVLPNPSVRQQSEHTLHTFITSALSCDVSLGLH